MNRRKLGVVAALLGITGAGLVTAAPVAAQSTTYNALVYSPSPIAPSGSLAAGGTVTLCLRAEESGALVPDASVDLSLATLAIPSGDTGTGGSASVGSTALSSTPALFTTPTGTGTCTPTGGTAESDALAITYTAPNPYPGPKVGGRDVVTATNPADSTVTNSAVYEFSPVAQFVFSPAPVAQSGALSSGQQVNLTVEAETSGGAAVASVNFLLSLSSTAASGGQATATDVSGHATALSSTPTTVETDSAGQVSISFTAGSASSGADTITAQNHSTATVSATDTYTYLASQASTGGGYSLDAFGGIHPFGDSPAVTATGYWPGWDIARAIALNPCDSSGQISGWVMDGFGGLHPFAAAGTPMPAVPDITGYWPGWTIANDVAAFCINVNNVQHAAGCVLDGFGGLHPWADSSAVIGDVPCTGTGYWPGWDIATKITVIPGTDEGYVMDGFGGLHPFNGAQPVTPSGYWPGWTIARDVVATADGAGYTLDGFGGIHAFGSAPAVTPTGYWPNWDIARGIDAAAGGTGVYVLDGFGGVHPAGGAPSLSVTGYWPGWAVVRDFITAP